MQIKGLEKNKIIPLIIKNICTGEELKKIFLFSKNIIEALNLINNYYELILEKLKNKSDSNFFKQFILYFWSDKTEIELPKPKENDDINLILKEQKDILKKENNNKDKIQIVNFNKIINELIIINEKCRNWENLLLIKKMISLQKEEHKSYEDNETKNNEAIHDVGIVLTMKKHKNKEIINFIENDIFYTNEKYSDHSKRDENVFKSFDIHNIDKEEFRQLENLQIWNIFH